MSRDWLLSLLLYLYDVFTTHPATITSLRYELRVSESLPCKTLHVAGAGYVFAQVDVFASTSMISTARLMQSQ